jgi:ABC-type nitrate/sulfonate/bicarbonate transport system permease component
VLVAAVTAAESADDDLLDMVRGLGAGRWTVLWLVRLPAAIPAALGGLRIAATYTIGAAVVAEYMAGESGLGVFIQRSRKAFAIDQIFVAVAVIGLLTAALFLLIDYLSALAMPWQRTDPLRSENP